MGMSAKESKSTSFIFDVRDSDKPAFDAWIAETECVLSGYGVTITAKDRKSRLKSRQSVLLTVEIHPEVRARGAGRKYTTSVDEIRQLYAEGHNVAEIAKMLACSPSTVYRGIREE